MWKVTTTKGTKCTLRKRIILSFIERTSYCTHILGVTSNIKDCYQCNSTLLRTTIETREMPYNSTVRHLVRRFLLTNQCPEMNPETPITWVADVILQMWCMKALKWVYLFIFQQLYRNNAAYSPPNIGRRNRETQQLSLSSKDLRQDLVCLGRMS